MAEENRERKSQAVKEMKRMLNSSESLQAAKGEPIPLYAPAG